MPVNHQVTGIRIHYCIGGRPQEPKWLDLNRATALAWTTDAIDEKQAGSGNGNMPTSTQAMACPPRKDDEKQNVLQTTGGPMCWWDGNQWVCGDLT